MMNLKLTDILDYNMITRMAKDPLYKNSIFLALTNIFNHGCGFIWWMIAARLYPIEDVGIATALVSYLGLVILFSRLGFDFSIIRFFQTNDKAKIFGTCLIVTTIASFLVASTFIFLVELISPSLSFLKEPVYAFAFVLIVFVNSIAQITQNAFVADRKADHYLFQNIFMALRIPLLIPLAFLGSFGILSSYGISFFIASLFAMMFFQRKIAAIQLGVDVDFLKLSFRFSFWNYASNILSLAPIFIMPVMILNLLGEEEAAKYFIAFAIANLAFVVPQSLGTSLFVEGSHGESLKKSLVRAGGASLALLIPCMLVLFIFGNNLLGLFAEDYIEAYDLLIILTMSGALVTLYLLFISIQNIRMKVVSIAVLNALRCVLLVGSSYLLIQNYGIMGAAYSWVITYVAISLIIAWVAKREHWI